MPTPLVPDVSVLYREPKLLKAGVTECIFIRHKVSVLYREPKLLKGWFPDRVFKLYDSFSALP